MIIVGITGTLGAGKGTIVDYLVSKKGFFHYSARKFITEEIEKRGLPVNRDNMTEVANDLRAKYGPGHIAEELYKRAASSGENSVIESLRAVGEINLLRRHDNFYLFAVDADPQKRYQRIVLRWSETDYISYDQFLSNEKREFKSDDPAKQNLSKCIELADYVFTNDGTIEDLQSQVAVALKEILKNEQGKTRSP